ncbi:MAG: hypothetical protein MASP_01432 [Candidatus Methanolliviera sp. GoM_asphalt]|nr:MAG: hypothetical protein MASP_01432 [Candidatus Methanolliviera sp. GoM_asphalt]
MNFSMSSKIFDFWDPTTKSSGEKEQIITRSSDCADYKKVLNIKILNEDISAI